ncbi:hypothetical protein MRY87_07195 [bacterium]|nr:hypothetical protein [bacterium]
MKVVEIKNSVSLAKAMETCFVEELRSAYWGLAKRFIGRVLLVFLIFVSSILFVHGVVSAAPSGDDPEVLLNTRLADG